MHHCVFLPSPLLPAPVSQGFWLQHSTSHWGVVGPLGSTTVPNVGVLGCNFVACNLVLRFFFNSQISLYGGWVQTGGAESGRSSYRRRVGSTACGSIIGRECYESWVDLLSSHVTTSFHNDMPMYRGSPFSIKAVFGVPDRTLSKKKSQDQKIQKIEIHQVHRK